jgi:hypothetical protein
MLDKTWIIKDGQIPDGLINFIKSQHGTKELIFRDKKSTRTSKQNAALHLWFDQLAKALNDDGFDMRAVISKDIMWTPYNVKEYLWRPTQKALFGTKSTTRLNKTEQIDKIFDVINKVVGERCGIFIPFPSYED